MDSRSVGKIIADLRKQHGLTQCDLAKRLNVSDKAVSKWESGMGYPEISQFPVLSSIFGVSIDFLMTGTRRGIGVAGNILTDLVKQINCFPEPGMLANIESYQRAVGGCAANTAIDLARIDPTLPVSVYGRIGNDDNGRFALAQLSRHGISCEGISISEKCNTSFADVMTLPNGERTFFHNRGANAEFSPASIDLTSLNCSILHIGYILLLDAFDSYDPLYGTVMARFLHDIEGKGIRTSIDMVSDALGNYSEKVVPALKQCSYAIMNEVESELLSGFSSRLDSGLLNRDHIHRSLHWIADQGVKEKVIIHSREGCFCLNIKNGLIYEERSLAIPADRIRSNVGAGDAFSAGCLYSIYNHYDDAQMLFFASSVAASSLFADNATDSVMPRSDIENLIIQYGRMTGES